MRVRTVRTQLARLERVLHDEDKGIGFNRGLTPDGCQTFEMFLAPDTAVQLPNGDLGKISLL